ncbi:MAG: prepilin peptidase [Candidatus Bathyarchaeota archaeon]|nr:prepilin peptidase [Candidatus Bathyarchaeota archaeon]
MQEILAAAQVSITAAFLVYASWSDYKTREVTNKVWAVYAPIALTLSLIQFLVYQPGELWLFGVSVGVTVCFAFLLFYSGGFGGADSKALMCIALSLPFFPVVLVKPVLIEGLSPLSQMIFPITILSNAVLIAALGALCLLVWNLASKSKSNKPLFEGSLAQESIGKKILVLVTGKKFPISTLKEKWHVYPMDDVAAGVNPEAWRRKLVVVPKDDGRNEMVARLSEAAEAGKIESKVWATPGLPMLIFITAGLLVALCLGDVIWVLVARLFG